MRLEAGEKDRIAQTVHGALNDLAAVAMAVRLIERRDKVEEALGIARARIVDLEAKLRSLSP